MTTPDSLTAGDPPERARLIALIEQLQASCSWSPKGYWRPYLVAGLYGIIAVMEGGKFFAVYCGVSVVVFMLQSFSEQRTRKQIDLLVELIRELEKKR